MKNEVPLQMPDAATSTTITARKPFTIARWTIATFRGWLLGVVLIILLSSVLGALGIEHMQFYVGVGMGTGVAFTQWLLLRKYTAISSNWIWAAVAGMGIPFIALDLIFTQNIAYKLPLSVAIGGLAVGLIQFIILKNYTQKAWLWMLASFIGWTLAALTVFTINYTMLIKGTGIRNLFMALLNLFIILVGGVILGIITGRTLKRMGVMEKR